MMYRVKEYFTDLQDENRAYNVGDIFPREGVKVSAERLAELASADNRRGRALIELVQTTVQKAEKSEEPVEAEEAKAEKPKRKKKSE